jgi:hypothetical protein
LPDFHFFPIAKTSPAQMRLREPDRREFFIMDRSVTATIILPVVQTLERI